MKHDLDVATRVCLTQFLNHHKSADGPHTNVLGRCLKRYGSTRLRSDAGPEPTIPEKPVSSLQAYFSKAGRRFQDLTCRRDIDMLVHESQREHGHGHERLSLEMLVDIFGVDYIALVQLLIVDGPDTSCARANAMLRQFLDEPARVTVRRPDGGKRSAGAIGQIKQALTRVWTIVVQMNRTGAYPELKDWTWTPTIDKSLSGLEEATVKQIPTWHHVRHSCAEADRKIWSLLGVQSESEEIDALGRLSPKKLATAERLFLLRAELAILANTGARIGSVRTTKIRHIQDLGDRSLWEHFPQKSHDTEISVPKALHPKTLHAITSYITVRYTRRGTTPEPDHPLFMSPKIETKRHGNMTALSYTSFRLHCRELLGEAYSPHTIRAAVAQCLTSKRCGRLFDAHEFDYEQRLVGEVQLDHQRIPGDEFHYGGYSSRSDRIKILRETGLIIGEMLWTDAGKRHVPDAETFKRCLEDRRAISAQIEILRAERKRLAPSDRARTVSARHHTITDEIDDLRDRREEIEKHITALRLDPDYEIPVPDDIAYPPRVDLKAIEQAFLQASPNVATRADIRPSQATPTRVLDRWPSSDRLPTRAEASANTGG